ncbi:MAG: hypothetical protein Q7W54_14940, partial [Bacteroidota bacterium]|nr:hypothetical protein [Bacteroidota bacterium]
LLRAQAAECRRVVFHCSKCSKNGRFPSSTEASGVSKGARPFGCRDLYSHLINEKRRLKISALIHVLCRLALADRL